MAAGLEKAGSVGKVNSAEVTPIDLCRWQIYQDKYYQLKGNTDKQISQRLPARGLTFREMDGTAER